MWSEGHMRAKFIDPKTSKPIPRKRSPNSGRKKAGYQAEPSLDQNQRVTEEAPVQPQAEVLPVMQQPLPPEVQPAVSAPPEVSVPPTLIPPRPAVTQPFGASTPFPPVLNQSTIAAPQPPPPPPQAVPLPTHTHTRHTGEVKKSLTTSASHASGSSEFDSFANAFFAKTYTHVQARKRLHVVEQAVEEATYTKAGGKTLQSVISSKKDVSEEDKKEVLTFLSSVQIPKDGTTLKKLFEFLQNEITNRPVATLTISFEPTLEQIERYGEWFRKNVGTSVLLNLLMSAEVIGGASITWNGKQVTYDLKYLLHQRQTEIIGVLDKYVGIKKKERVI